MKTRLTHCLFAVLAVAALSAAAFAADMSATWDVDGNVAGNPVKYALALKQDGETLAGTAKLDGKDIPVTGTVHDKNVMWKFDVEYNGSPLTLEFTGTMSSDTDIKGSIAVMGVTGDFTAKRQ